MAILYFPFYLSTLKSGLVPRSKYLFPLAVLNIFYLSYAGFENLAADQDITRLSSCLHQFLFSNRKILYVGRDHLNISDFVIA